MNRIIILTIGRLKEKHYQTAFLEYQKRLKPFVKLEVVELEAVPFSESNRVKAKAEESEKILAYLKKYQQSFIVVCDEIGQQFSSQDFAVYLEKINQPIIFIVGGTQGLEQSVRSGANLIWSFSKMTLPHELFRVALIEQIYRATTILQNKQYHY